MRFLPALAVVAVLAFAGCTAKTQNYPEKYLLKGAEIPADLKLSEIPPEMGQYLPSNPGQVPSQFVSGLGNEFQGFAPDQAWAEFLQKSSDAPDHPTGGLVLAPLYYVDAQKAQDAANKIKTAPDNACAQAANNENGGGTVLRDGNVIVLVGGDNSMKPYFDAVASALQKKAPGLTKLC